MRESFGVCALSGSAPLLPELGLKILELGRCRCEDAVDLQHAWDLFAVRPAEEYGRKILNVNRFNCDIDVHSKETIQPVAVRKVEGFRQALLETDR
jgi:hypothetical protein